MLDDSCADTYSKEEKVNLSNSPDDYRNRDSASWGAPPCLPREEPVTIANFPSSTRVNDGEEPFREVMV